MKELSVLQLVPENATSNYSLEPLKKETIIGDLLEWKFEKVLKGTRIVVTHSLNENMQIEKPVEVRVESEKGEKKTFFSHQGFWF